MAKYSGSYEQTMVKLEQMAQATNAQQMNWQEKMSKTSHQMEVADLVAAGLNPVLSSGGSGAQSYTTSLDSAASAVGNLASAHESASATRYAARQSAAATRAAAAANLAAAREAASASRYAADKGLEATKFSVTNSKTGSFAGLLDNLRRDTKDDNTGLFANISKSYKDLAKNPSKYVRNKNKSSISDVYDLNASGRNIIQKTLRGIGVKENYQNQMVVFNALFRGDSNANAKLKAWISTFNRRTHSAINKWSTRTGSGMW